VITDSPWEDNAVERGILESSDFYVSRAECKTVDEVIATCRHADALLVGWAPIRREVIEKLERCRFIIRYGIGYDNIDVTAATDAGIAVANNADYCIEEVATHALALVLASHRQLSPLMHSVQSGEWDPLAVMLPMPQLRDQVVGLIGFGRIGARLGEMLRSLVAEVLVYDPALPPKSVPLEGVRLVSFEQLLARSDYVSIHCPLNEQTRNLFTAKTIALLRPGAYLINCSRGGIIDESALVEALESKRIAGAALDVVAEEPLAMDNPLRRFANVIVTPHAAWYSADADYLLRANPARAIVRFFAGEQLTLLNQPRPRSSRL